MSLYKHIWSFRKVFFIAIFFTITHTSIAKFIFTSIDDIQTTNLEEGYYLIVGVFSSVENAERYSKELTGKGYSTDYAFSEVKKMYYCFLMHSDSIGGVKDKYEELRKLPEFYSVWILKIKNKQETKITDIDQEKTVKPVVVEDKSDKTLPYAVKGSVMKNGRDISKTHQTYKVIITVKDEHNKDVPSSIQIMNAAQNKVIANIKCNQEGTFHIPKKESQIVELICEVFGYHKTEIALPLGDPIAMSALKNVKVEGDKISVDLTLEKVHKGDLMIMFNVFFQPNSNIMRQVSETDLKTLVSIMNDYPTLKIMVHGHTNGNSSGEIIKIPDSCDNFFAPKDLEYTKGSSMKLSLLRAEAIKMYLIKNGIAAERIEVKGWGGKKMLYEEDSPNYQQNVRVEVEVIDI